MWQKTARVELRGADVTPAEVIRTWKAEFQRFWPGAQLVLRPPDRHRPRRGGPAQPDLPGRMKLSTGVLVLYADDESFTLMTPEGHMLAGWITFSAWAADDGVTVVQIQALERTNDPLYELGYVLGGNRLNTRFWVQTAENLARHFGVEPRSSPRWSAWTGAASGARPATSARTRPSDLPLDPGHPCAGCGAGSARPGRAVDRRHPGSRSATLPLRGLDARWRRRRGGEGAGDDPGPAVRAQRRPGAAGRRGPGPGQGGAGPAGRGRPAGRVNRALVRALGDHGPHRPPPSGRGPAARGAEAAPPAALGARAVPAARGPGHRVDRGRDGPGPPGAGRPPDRGRRRPGRCAAGGWPRWRRGGRWPPSPVGAGGRVGRGRLELRAEADGRRVSGSPGPRPGSPTPPRPTSTACSPAPPPGPARGASPPSPCPATPPAWAASRSSCSPPTPSGRLELDGVRVGPDQVLGRVDEGFGLAMATLDRFRPSVGAFAVGMAQAALDVAVAHAAGRRPSAGPWPSSRPWPTPWPRRPPAPRRPGCWSTRRPAATTPTRRPRGRRGRGHGQAVRHRDRPGRGRPGRPGAGGRALERGHLLEHLYREVRAPRIYEGTSEIQRSVIARELFRARVRP
jgi:hypothetical protein